MKIKILQNTFVKIISTGTLVMFLFLGITSIGSTVSYYRDNEKSLNNTLNTKSLNFDVLVDGQDEVQVDLTSGEVTLTPILTMGQDSFQMQYWVSAQVVGGDIELCNAIDLLGTFPFPYNNRLNLLQTATTSQTGAWTNTFSIWDGAENHQNTSCTFDLIYRGSIDGTSSSNGYRDTQVVKITFNVGSVVENTIQASIVTDEVSDAQVTPSIVENTEESQLENIVTENTEEE